METQKQRSSLFAPDTGAAKTGQRPRSPRRARGFSIFEMLLSVAAMGVALGFAIQIMSENEYRNVGRGQAEQMGTFEQVVANYYWANREEMMSAMSAAAATDANVQKHCVIRVTTPTAAIVPGTTPGTAGTNGTLAWSSTRYTCAFDASTLVAKGLWPGSSMGVTGHDPDMGGDWAYVAIFRRQRLAGPDGTLGNTDDTWSPDAEMLIVRADVDGTLPTINTDAVRKDSQRMLTLTSQRLASGTNGGVIPVGDLSWCSATSTAVQVCGLGWTMDLTNFIDAGSLTTLKTALPAS